MWPWFLVFWVALPFGTPKQPFGTTQPAQVTLVTPNTPNDPDVAYCLMLLILGSSLIPQVHPNIHLKPLRLPKYHLWCPNALHEPDVAYLGLFDTTGAPKHPLGTTQIAQTALVTSKCTTWALMNNTATAGGTQESEQVPVTVSGLGRSPPGINATKPVQNCMWRYVNLLGLWDWSTIQSLVGFVTLVVSALTSVVRTVTGLTRSTIRHKCPNRQVAIPQSREATPITQALYEDVSLHVQLWLFDNTLHSNNHL